MRKKNSCDINARGLAAASNKTQEINMKLDTESLAHTNRKFSAYKIELHVSYTICTEIQVTDNMTVGRNKKVIG